MSVVLEEDPFEPFVLEHPSADNDYTAMLFISDEFKGYGAWAFELYFVDTPPEDLGLAIPWEQRPASRAP